MFPEHHVPGSHLCRNFVFMDCCIERIFFSFGGQNMRVLETVVAGIIVFVGPVSIGFYIAHLMNVMGNNASKGYQKVPDEVVELAAPPPRNCNQVHNTGPRTTNDMLKEAIEAGAALRADAVDEQLNGLRCEVGTLSSTLAKHEEALKFLGRELSKTNEFINGGGVRGGGACGCKVDEKISHLATTVNTYMAQVTKTIDVIDRRVNDWRIDTACTTAEMKRKHADLFERYKEHIDKSDEIAVHVSTIFAKLGAHAAAIEHLTTKVNDLSKPSYIDKNEDDTDTDTEHEYKLVHYDVDGKVIKH